MKSIGVTFLFALCFSHTSAKRLNISLHSAIERRLVTATVTGNGGYQGYCAMVNVTNKTNDSLGILVCAGDRLVSVDQHEQDLLITSSGTLLMKARDKSGMKVKAYCCEAKMHAPAPGSLFRYTRNRDNALVSVAMYLNVHPFDPGAEQYAIWSISENRSAVTITSTYDERVAELRQLVADLRHEQLPLYTISQATQVFASGYMETKPVTLRTKINFSCEADSYCKTTLVNEKGTQVCFETDEWRLTGEHNLEMFIPVSGLAAGKYKLVVTTQGRELFSREIQL